MKTGLWVAMAGVLAAGQAWALEPKKIPEPIEMEEKGAGAAAEHPADCGGCGSCGACEEKMGEACKKTCEELKAHPGTVKECCGKFCASHKGKDGKAELACHMGMKCCAEHFAKTGEKACPKCAAHDKEAPKGPAKKLHRAPAK